VRSFIAEVTLSGANDANMRPCRVRELGFPFKPKGCLKQITYYKEGLMSVRLNYEAYETTNERKGTLYSTNRYSILVNSNRKGHRGKREEQRRTVFMVV
jgi:hypothetical protein